MRGSRLIAILGSCLIVVLIASAQADDEGKNQGVFTEKSLNGLFYIPCACEGNNADVGGSIHSAGMGSIHFDGEGNATITQLNLYTESGNTITRVVNRGYFPDNTPARFNWKYEVYPEGYGCLYGDPMGTGVEIQCDDPYSPSFLITKVEGSTAKEIYLILPQNLIDFPPDPLLPLPGPKHLIHVTASLRW